MNRTSKSGGNYKRAGTSLELSSRCFVHMANFLIAKFSMLPRKIIPLTKAFYFTIDFAIVCYPTFIH